MAPLFPLPDSLTLKVCPPLQPVELNPFPPALQPRSLYSLSLSLFSFPFRSLVSSIPTTHPLPLPLLLPSPPFKPQLSQTDRDRTNISPKNPWVYFFIQFFSLLFTYYFSFRYPLPSNFSGLSLLKSPRLVYFAVPPSFRLLSAY